MLSSTRQADDARLGAAVTGFLGETDLAGDGRDIDDIARPLRDHGPGHCLAAEEHAGQVHGDDTLPLYQVRLVRDVAGVKDPGVVDPDVDPSPVCQDLVDGGLDACLVSDVQVKSQPRRGRSVDFLRSGLCGFNIQVQQRDPSPLAGETTSDPQSNAAGSAGDGDYLSLKSHQTLPIAPCRRLC
jgi:hypothetical protein